MNDELHIYVLGPIDTWRGFTPLTHWRWGEETANVVLRALVAAVRAGFDGNLRPGEEIYLSGLPCGDDESNHVVVGLKQDNNGTVFLVSPVDLPYLKEQAIEYVRVAVPSFSLSTLRAIFNRAIPVPSPEEELRAIIARGRRQADA
ncbi:MAG: hypothetical protein HPY90_13585 [Syntrophothermus sp.]|uniref:hypothetical protein n=1 Tax=Syntrophothermus sp. TaxID=2736299 RepID=UPI00257B4EED|nr:hypothetical protein [Syntrophothermus sp.]NSW84277.1 hypothetical protein [Syntrophothermus sp.]